MATFSYARKDGTQGIIEAPDPQAALKMMPADADPHSGVQLEKGTPASLPSLPPGGGAAPSALPDTGTSKSPLLSYASALEEAVNLARQHRNASSVDIMKPFQGTAMASDFNSILGGLNTASDKFSGDLMKTASDLSKTDIITATSDNGDVHGIDKNTGKIVWTAKGAGNAQESSKTSPDTLIKSGALNYTRADYADDSSTLEISRGQDGWVDPTKYQQLYEAWVQQGGKISDFISTFPPDKYVNPENDWLPIYLRPKKSGVANPFAS